MQANQTPTQAAPRSKPVNTELFEALGQPLPIECVEFRVQSVSVSGWAIILAYKSARVDMDRLDQVVGRGFWQRKHERIDSREYCHVSIWNTELGQWVTVSDVGVPSNTEAVKGEASDAFKRACFNLGIGRELYDYPLILVELKPHEFEVYEEPAKGNYPAKKKARATFKLRLKDWVWACERTEPDEHGKTQITVLAALDENQQPRYRYAQGARGGGQGQAPQHQDDSRGTSERGASTDKGNAGTRNQSDKPAAGGGEKPWFDAFDEQRAWFIEQFGKGVKADAIINKLKEKYKVNKKTESAIRDLAADNS